MITAEEAKKMTDMFQTSIFIQNKIKENIKSGIYFVVVSYNEISQSDIQALQLLGYKINFNKTEDIIISWE